MGDSRLVSAGRLIKNAQSRGLANSFQAKPQMRKGCVLLQRGLSPLIIVSADSELNTAAQTEGLNVENPNNYS